MEFFADHSLISFHRLLPQTDSRVFGHYEINGVDVCDLPSPSMLKNKVQEATKIHLGLVRKGQRSTPLLNLDRLDFVDETSTPTRSYPAMQAGEMRLLGSIA
jgi:hypothetical protein